MLDGWQWVFAGIGAALVGLSKTGVPGLGVFTVALFASLLPPRASVGVLLVVLLAGDIVAVTVYRQQAQWRYLIRLFPWAALGIVLGALMLGQIPDAVLRILISIILIALVVLHVLRRGRAAAPTIHPALAGGTGLLAGVTTMLANAAGPLMTIYLLAMRLPSVQFMGTAAWFFFVVNAFKVPFSYQLGLISRESLALSLPLVPFAVAGALLGRRVLPLLNQQMFEMVALLLTLLAAVRLLFL